MLPPSGYGGSPFRQGGGPRLARPVRRRTGALHPTKQMIDPLGPRLRSMDDAGADGGVGTGPAGT
jgi:hypothetical protein